MPDPPYTATIFTPGKGAYGFHQHTDAGGDIGEQQTGVPPNRDYLNKEYNEGDVDDVITGRVFLWEDAGNTLRPIGHLTPLPIQMESGSKDSVSNAIITIEFAHHEIHEGDHYFYTDTITLDSSESQVYVIETPNTSKWTHMVFALEATAGTTVDFYEGSDTSGVTLEPSWNNNRNSSNTAGTTVHKGLTGGTSSGTLIYENNVGDVHKAGGAVRGDSELILATGTKYLLNIASTANSNNISLDLEWYEHTNSN